MIQNVCIIGDGGWATALAIHLASHGQNVRIWGIFPEHLRVMREHRENRKFLPGMKIPCEVEILDDFSAARDGATIFVVAVPTQFIRNVLRKIRKAMMGCRTPVINVAKGIETKTLFRGTDIIRDVFGTVPVGALSGPSHAEEVARGLPCMVMGASPSRRVRELIKDTFETPRFRVNLTSDLIGVELGGAFKNVIGILGGLCDGLRLGDNTKSALITKGLEEMVKLGVAMGARKPTLYGLAGIGDLITTSISPYGRNRAVGEKIARGMKLEEIVKGMEMVAEGVWTTRVVCELARKYCVDVPIMTAMNDIVFKGKQPLQTVTQLIASL